MVVLLQDSILLLSPLLKPDAQKHQTWRRNRSVWCICSQHCAAEDSCCRTPGSAVWPSPCPVQGTTTGYLFFVRNETLMGENGAWKKQGAEGSCNGMAAEGEICGERRSKDSPWKGILISCKGKASCSPTANKACTGINTLDYVPPCSHISHPQGPGSHYQKITALLQSCYYYHDKNMLRLCRVKNCTSIIHIWYLASSLQ